MMSKSVSRLLATNLSRASHVQGSITLPIRSFSQTCRRRADEPSTPAPAPAEVQSQKDGAPKASAPPGRSILERTPKRSAPPQRPASFSALKGLTASLSQSKQTGGPQLAKDAVARARNQPSTSDILSGVFSDSGARNKSKWGDEPFHFHIYSHRHNTHITVTKPDRNPIISMSAGQLGFRKSKRGNYDAAYQLAAHVVDKLHQGNWHKEMHKIEVVLRGFGNGREAGCKVLLGNEGRMLKPKIVMVADATRLKFGGTRSQRPRRL